jgi:HK97 family phage portal protein
MFLSKGSLVTKTPVSLTSSSWFTSMPAMSGGWPSAYAGIFTRQLWVYVVVNKLGKATARLPLVTYRRDELNRPRADDHPMAKLLARPNPGLSTFRLLEWTSNMQDIYGDAFWLKQRDSAGTVVALYPLHPASMSYNKATQRWRFDNGNVVLPAIEDTDLVHFKSFHPDDEIRGLSPLEPLRATLENEWSARTATSSFWQRGSRPGMAFEHPQKLSAEAHERLRKDLDSSTGAQHTGRTVILEEGMKASKLDLTAEEAQYIETRKLNREETCGAYDVPPPVVHILDRATFSNITEQMRSMYRDTMAPRLTALEATIELDLRMAEWPNDDVYSEFLMDEVLRGDFETRQDALAKATHMTIAEKRKIENLPFIEGTDRIFLNTATMPLDAIDAQADAIVAGTMARPPAQIGVTEDGSAVAPVIPIATARSAVGRLSWQSTLADVDAEALTKDMRTVQADAVRAAVDAELKAGGTIRSLRNRILGMATATKAKISSPDKAPHEARIHAVLKSFFERQEAAVIGAGEFDMDRWVKDLTENLHAASVSISSSVGRTIMKDLELHASNYDLPRTAAFLESVSQRLAQNINTTTKAQYDAAVADPDREPREVFETAKTSRAAGIAVGVSTLAVNFAVNEAARQAGEATGRDATKTWITGPNARPSHAAMDGETVPLSENFSNGLAWPGDGAGDVDEVAGCNCELQIDL